MHEIIKNIWLMDKFEEPNINSEQIQTIINISPTTLNTHYDIEYYRIKDTLNSDNTPIDRGYDIACEFLHDKWHSGKKIGVHCNNGYQRSIPFLAYYLLEYHNISIDKSVTSMVKEYSNEYIINVKHILKIV